MRHGSRVPSLSPSQTQCGVSGPALARRVGVNTVSRFDRTPVKTQTARRLRQDSTVVERRLWYRLRNGQIDGHRFRRQHSAGPYVLDFYCPKLRLAIELDGGQHNFATEIGRDRRLRFWNSDVIENMTGVLEKIAIAAS